MRKRRGREGGFTLLELLMVVIIIAILASIALPQYFRVVERARSAQMLQLLASIRGSELRFKAQDSSNLYTTDLTPASKLDIAPLPIVLPTGWAAPIVSGTASGANAQSARTGTGPTGGAFIAVDIDTGAVCASTAAAAAEWNVPNSAVCP